MNGASLPIVSYMSHSDRDGRFEQLTLPKRLLTHKHRMKLRCGHQGLLKKMFRPCGVWLGVSTQQLKGE